MRGAIARATWIALVLGLAAAPGPPAAADEAAGPEWPGPPVELAILGTFHFKDAGLDSYRPQHDVDILSPERQAEVAALVERLAGFRPNKIAVEWPVADQAGLDRRYAAYRAGGSPPSPDELEQLGFRLAAALGHQRVWAVDAKRRFYEPWVDPDEYAAAHGQEGRLDGPLWELYERQLRYEDELKTRMPLADYLLRINSPEQLALSHGQYLVGNFEVGSSTEYPGVDSKTAWFNRNLKIFANLQRIADMEGDRLLLVIGSGHVPILRHAALASPQFELVELAELLAPAPPWPWPDSADAVAAAPDSHLVVLDTERVRVLRVVIPPGEREPMHTHRWPSVMLVDQPARIRYYGADGELRFESRSEPDPSSPVTPDWLGPEGLHAVENVGSLPFGAWRIELKPDG